MLLTEKGFMYCVLEKDVLGDLLGQYLQQPMTSIFLQTSLICFLGIQPQKSHFPQRKPVGDSCHMSSECYLKTNKIGTKHRDL